MTAAVSVEHRGPVAIVWMRRPERRNAIVPEMGRAFIESLREVDADPDVRAVVIAGAGPAFCAGADLSVLAEGYDALTAFSDDHALRDLAVAPMVMSTPVATAVQGAAAGAGFVLAIAGDTTFVAPDARFIPVFPRFGLVAEYGVAWLLPRRIGAARAADVLLTGREIDADTAVQWGLANEIADNPVATAKRQLTDGAHESFAQSHARSLDLMRESFARPDLAEALMARVDGRDADFAPYPAPLVGERQSN